MGMNEEFTSTLVSGQPTRIPVRETEQVFTALRRSYALSVSEMSRSANVDRLTVRRYCIGETSPTLKRFVRMMDRLGFDVALIQRREDS